MSAPAQSPAALTDTLIEACDRSLAQINAALAEIERQRAEAIARHAQFEAEMRRIDEMQAQAWGRS